MRVNCTLEEIRQAAARLAPHLLPTPCLESDWLSERAGRPVYVKWESLQRTGSFKLRGALNKLLLLQARGVTRVLAISAGNHGLGVAYAARRLGLHATVVVPEGAAQNKVAAIVRQGAALVVRGHNYDEAELAARALAEERGEAFVSPYNDLELIAGQATVALELLEQVRCDALLVPTGGGGLLSGALLVAQAIAPETQVYGAQPAHAPALHTALHAGRRVVVQEEPTLADGLAGNLEEGSVTLPIILSGQTRDIFLVRERAIERAIRGFAQHDHQIVEGSGAVGAAALLEQDDERRRRQDQPYEPPLPGQGPVGLLVTGRNIDLGPLARILTSTEMTPPP
ncbi:MAG TPA: pyridoxal-phosphate dependent enzyme [Polyangia bacterium]|jgi:threonine dehydratase|nr:pyridoxal-phosphate dependent enzyme [Polyangia bacterium]